MHALSKLIVGTQKYFHLTRQRISMSARFSSRVAEKNEFKPKKILVLTKLTRYEFEKNISDSRTDDELRHYLSDRGSDYSGLLQRHEAHHAKLDCIKTTLQQRGFETQVVDRFSYTPDKVDWADAVFSAGGDGTFLLAASKINDRSKPLIGINTDPARSEGYLCLPSKYSDRFPDALDRLQEGKFSWQWRQRIRVTMSGKHANDDPIELHDEVLLHKHKISLEHRFQEHVKENEMHSNISNLKHEMPTRVLPALALNDVYIGECLSARVSYYEMSTDNSHSLKQKSSGVTVCTGTGSSSWHFNISHLPKEHVYEILKITGKLTHCKIPLDEPLLAKVASTFNQSLKYSPSELKLAYTVRDPVVNGIYHVPVPRGFANKITIRSRMWDACLAIDGGMSFKFNDGATATFEMYEEDALRTVTFETIPAPASKL